MTKKVIIWSVWVLLWLTPVCVAMIGDSPILMVIALIWGVIMYKFSVAYAPGWMKDVLDQIFVDELFDNE